MSQLIIMDKKKLRYADVARTPPAPPKPAAPSPAQSITSLTQRELKQGIETFTTQFQDSPRFQSLATFFEQGQKMKITQCICLGLGRFRNFHGHFNASLHRLAMLEMLLEKLANAGDGENENKNKNKNKIQVYFQDAAFTDPEKHFLEPRGYEVLSNDNDSVFAKMKSPCTFLFAPYLSAVLLSTAVMDDNFPALYVGTDLNEAIEDISTHYSEEELERYLRPLLRYRNASFEGKQLPILAHGATKGGESWKYASVRWLGAAGSGDGGGGGGMGEERRVGKEGGRGGKGGNYQSTLASGSGEKGKREGIIDWWSYEPTGIGR